MYLAILFIFVFLCLEFAGRKGCEVWVSIGNSCAILKRAFSLSLNQYPRRGSKRKLPIRNVTTFKSTAIPRH